MAAKKTGLASFSGSREAATGDKDAPLEEMRTKGKGEIVHVTLRLSRDQWERAH